MTESVRRLLRKTIEVLRKKPWGKYEAYDPDTGAVCLVGAIHFAAGHGDVLAYAGDHRELWTDESRDAVRVLRTKLGIEPSTFNDAEDTTKELVIERLERIVNEG